MVNLKSRLASFLRWSEKYTQTDMIYLARGGFWLTAGQMISSVAIFVLAVAFSNLIPKEIYGTYKYVLSIAGILTVLTLRGMDIAVLHAIARGFEGVFFRALRTRIVWGLLSAVASIVLGIYYYVNGNSTLALSFLIIAGFLPLVESLNIYQSLLRGKKLFRLSATYETVSQISCAVVLIATILVTQNLFIILLVYFASWTLLRFILMIASIKKYPPNQKNDPKTINYGKRTSIVNILDALVNSVDGLLIFHYLGAVNLAIYSFAIAPISQLKGITGHLPTLAMPKMATRSSVEINELLKKRMVLLFAIGVAISSLYIVAAPYFYQIFFPKYIDAVFFSQIFSLAMAFYLPQTIFSAAISSKLTLIPPKMLYLWNLPGVIFIFFALLFVVKLGIIGVIIGRLVSLIFGFIVNLIVWRKIKMVETMILQN